MVGVPGKSKGCSTCRRRKKGCDQKRPACGQCLAGGYECGGYERDRTFILHPSSKQVESATFVPYARVINNATVRGLEQSAINAQCQGLFWNLYMPHGDCMVKDPYILKCGHPMNWACMVNEVSPDTSLSNAFAALCVSRVGKENQDSRLVRDSTKMYGQALKNMQLALYDADRMHSDQVLIASMLLGLYETLEGSALDSNSWLSHAQGAARLIQLRGPERHRSRQAHHVFLGSRIPTVYAAIAQRRATYLAAEEWKTIPWETEPRTYYDRLVDLVTKVPGLLGEVDATTLGTANPLTFSRKWELLNEMAQLQRNLDTWKRNVKKEAIAHHIPHKHDEDDIYPFETDVWFTNHLFVNAHCVYWTASLALAETALALAADLRSYKHKSPRSEIDNLKKIFLPTDHATNIVKSITYCLQPDMGALGTCIINFSANLALRYFSHRGDLRVVTWLSRVFRDMRNRGLQYNPQLLHQTVAPTGTVLSSDSSITTPTHNVDSPRSSSDDASRSSATPPPAETVMLKFVAEDPSRFYIDIGNDSS